MKQVSNETLTNNLTTKDIAKMVAGGITLVGGLYLSFWIVIGLVQLAQPQGSTLGQHITKTIVQNKAK